MDQKILMPSLTRRLHYIARRRQCFIVRLNGIINFRVKIAVDDNERLELRAIFINKYPKQVKFEDFLENIIAVTPH